MLTNPFPNQETHMVAQDPSSSNKILMLSSTKPKSNVMVATQNKGYGNVNPTNN